MKLRKYKLTLYIQNVEELAITKSGKGKQCKMDVNEKINFGFKIYALCR